MAGTPTKKIKLPNRYVDTGKHFKGGFGEVQILHDQFLDRDVALKTIQDVKNFAQLKAEVLSISEIRSKNVIEIFDLIFDSSGDLQGIVEEYLSGNDLTEFADASYDKKRYLRAIYQIASGIADIHGHGLVHRDVKLNNMKLDGEKIIKLFDFGLSSKDSKHTTHDGKATIIYAAPELYSPPLKVETTLDIYAFGICCWLLGTSIANVPKELLATPPQKSGPAPSIAKIDASLPADLVSILDATLNPNPASRPSMSQVRDIVGKHLLFGSHRAWLTGGYHISAPNQSVSVGSPTVGVISITYDGIRFYVSSITGEVFVNNSALSVGDELPGSCVITIGGSALGAMRNFVQFNVSHPEIIL